MSAAPAAPPVETEETEASTGEILRPSAEPRTWVLSDHGLEVAQGANHPNWGERTYVQRTLASLAQFELFALLGDAVEEAMSGDRPLNISNLLAVAIPIRGQSFAPADIMDADNAVVAIAKLASKSPNLIADLICLMLNVPREERAWAQWVMSQPPRRDDEGKYLAGGLTMDEMVDIFETFFAQNGDELKRFFGVRLGGLFRQVTGQNDAAPAVASPSSKPTRRSGRTTRA